MKKSAGVFLLEVFLIIAGVLFGLTANEWRENRAAKKQAQVSLNYILLEIKNNQVEVDSIMTYHTQIRDSLRKLSNEILINKKVVTFIDLGDALPRGFQIPLLQSDAWELANQIGTINHIDYKVAESLSKLYSLQNFCQKKLDKIADNFYIASNINPDKISNLVLAFSSLSQDILVQEKRLSKYYPEIIKKLEEIN
jgi:hypothetical protein